MWVEDGALRLALSAPSNLAPGDLLRVTFPNQGYVLMLAVQLVKPIPAGALSPFANGPLWEVSGLALWFRSAAPLSPPTGPIPARLLTQDARDVDVLALAQMAEDGPIDVDLGLALENAPAPGSFVRLDFGGEQLWLTIKSVTGMAGDSSPLGDTVRISGHGLWRLHGPLVPLPIVDADTYGERLTFELWVGPGDYPIRLSDLGFVPKHPRFWGGLPSDDQLFAPTNKTALAAAPELSGLWREVAQPRFPLGGAAPAVYVPIGMPNIADVDQFLGAQLGAATALERDGLACFSADLFLDTALKDVGITALLEQADFVRYQQPVPRALAGIYAALEIDEATLIAVPDAVHRGWDRVDDAELPAPQPEAPSTPPEDCTPPRASTGEQGQFGDCAAIGAPQLFAITPPSGLAAYTIRWSPLAAPLVGYVLEEATRADFGDAQAVYTGAANQTTLDSARRGRLFLPRSGGGSGEARCRARQLVERGRRADRRPAPLAACADRGV